MSKIERKHSMGNIDGRFFITLTETSKRDGLIRSKYIALEKTPSGWVRHYVTRDRLAKLHRILTNTTASA